MEGGKEWGIALFDWSRLAQIGPDWIGQDMPRFVKICLIGFGQDWIGFRGARDFVQIGFGQDMPRFVKICLIGFGQDWIGLIGFGID